MHLCYECLLIFTNQERRPSPVSDDDQQREPYLEQPVLEGERHFSVGRQLRETRETYELDLREVASSLRIRPFYLEAIEDTRYEDLPGAAYAIGFVRAYADFLRLDSEELVERFKAEVSGLETRRSLQFPVPPQEGRVPGIALLLVAVLLAALGYGVWYYLGQEDRVFSERVEPLPEDLAELIEDAEPVELAPVEPEPVEPEPVAADPVQAAPEAIVEEPEAASSDQEAPAGSGPDAISSEAMTDPNEVAGDPGAIPEGAEPGSAVSERVDALPEDAAPMESGPAMESEPAMESGPAMDPEAELLAQDQTGAPSLAEDIPGEAAVEEVQAPAIPPVEEEEAAAPPAPVRNGEEALPEGRVYGAVDQEVRVVLTAERDSWIEVRDADGRLIISRVLRQGDSFRVPDREGLVMMTGNAGGLLIAVDGENLPRLGEQGEVRRNLPLSPDGLRQTLN